MTHLLCQCLRHHTSEKVPDNDPSHAPPGFILPSLMASKISGGMLALTKSRAISNKRSLVFFVLQERSQMFRGHPRWSPSCSSSGCAQADEEPIAVQRGVNLWSVSHHLRRKLDVVAFAHLGELPKWCCPLALKELLPKLPVLQTTRRGGLETRHDLL